MRGGEHSTPGYGTCEGGPVADPSTMKGVRVDPGGRPHRPGRGRAHPGIFMVDAPDEVCGGCAFITAPPEPLVPEPVRDSRILVLVLCYIGPIERGEKELRPLRETVPPAMGLQSMVDAGNPPGMRNQRKVALQTGCPTRPWTPWSSRPGGRPRRSSPLSQLPLLPIGGAIARTPEEATPPGTARRHTTYRPSPCGPTRSRTRNPHKMGQDIPPGDGR
ncbi:hypothetical protein Rxycam_02885 [Rubrobacter xylanophilus DSM 9941]|nr:hypothetical protein Rxycam_02885 [Rubrobacter xylanophilus DSM 9941]